MSNSSNRDGRITNSNTKKHIRAMLAEMVERGSYKSTARDIGWNVNPVHAIVKRNDFTQKILYPEDVALIELIHDLTMRYKDISDDARHLADTLIEQAHQFVGTARELRRLLRKI